MNFVTLHSLRADLEDVLFQVGSGEHFSVTDDEGEVIAHLHPQCECELEQRIKNSSSAFRQSVRRRDTSSLRGLAEQMERDALKYLGT